jgi:hypothetical protein
MSSNEDENLLKNPNFLKKQLEFARFNRAIETAYSMVDSGAFLNIAELTRINGILTGSKEDPWREDAAVCKLGSGREVRFQILADPLKKTKEILTNAKEKAASGDVIGASVDLYVELVMTHVFKDANRRTAVVACAYLLKLHGKDISAFALHELGLGDLRMEGQIQVLKEIVSNIVKLNVKNTL